MILLSYKESLGSLVVRSAGLARWPFYLQLLMAAAYPM